MRKSTLAITMTAVAAVGLGGLAMAQRDGGPPRGGTQDMGAQLMQGLAKTPGCLGVDGAQFRSGKNAIFAWFEDKEAVARWYHSPVHKQVMGMALGADAATHDHTPLSHVKDGVPVMVIASLTFTDKPEIEGIPMPISQIAIELYTPLSGGAYINGRLAPEKFKVEHMKSYTEPPAG